MLGSTIRGFVVGGTYGVLAHGNLKALLIAIGVYAVAVVAETVIDED